MKTIELVKKDANSSIRVVKLSLRSFITHYKIERYTGLLTGTMTEQPPIEIYAGKANRSVYQQAELEFNSILSDYLDKGYKHITAYNIPHIELITADVAKQILSGVPTDSRGFNKHLLAKLAPTTDDAIYNKKYASSYKIDGVRCSFRYDAATNKIRSSSRGGKHFDFTTQHISANPVLLMVMRNNPDIILDGELYIHGKPLEFISGLSRMIHYDPNIHAKLHFYVFDTMQNQPFLLRAYALNKFKEELQNMAIITGDLDILDYIRFVEHTTVTGFKNVMDLHDQAIYDGYEGLILRDPEAKYGYGVRDKRMLKVKLFVDDEFKIMGMTPGLRKEDMVFVMKLPDSNGTFEAKPIGSREQREYYHDHIGEYIGKWGNVKYFGYSIYGVPNLPVFRYVREI